MAPAADLPRPFSHTPKNTGHTTMSSRAIQRLRKERLEAPDEHGDSDEESSDEEEEHGTRAGSNAAFLAMMGDDSSSSSSSSSEDDDDNDDDDDDAESNDDADGPAPDDVENEIIDEDTKEEDLDDLLAEFESKDQTRQAHENPNDHGSGDEAGSAPGVLLSGLEPKDLDLEHTMRTSLMSSSSSSEPAPAAGGGRGPSSLSTFCFGPPRDGWVKPPHLVGGGMGMEREVLDPAGENPSTAIPWPYTENSRQCTHDNETTSGEDPDQKEEASSGDATPSSAQPAPQPTKQVWYSFVYSDTYQKDLEAFERIEGSGDANALALFVAQHPYCVHALLPLSDVLYQTNRSEEGLALLRRALWVLESSALLPFRSLSDSRRRGRFAGLLDHNRIENKPVFATLFRLVKVACIAGCTRTSLAASRYLLSLDPMRDPSGILPLLDTFALSTRRSEHDTFLVDLVESGEVPLFWCNQETSSPSGRGGASYQGGLLDLPNWAYSYALALFRTSREAIHNDVDSAAENSLREKANEALQKALRRFPTVAERLLDQNGVDLTGRSFRHDWPTTLGPIRKYTDRMVYQVAVVDNESDNIVLRHTAVTASDLLTRIYLSRASGLWASDDVVAWLYENCVRASDWAVDGDMSPIVVPISPALIRYAKLDLEEYEDRFRRLPPEADPLNPGLVAPALVVDPQHARRFARHNRQHQAQLAQWQEEQLLHHHQQQNRLFNLGGGDMQMIDPDLPMLEVFLRGMLPWNHIEGVPPPRR